MRRHRLTLFAIAVGALFGLGASSATATVVSVPLSGAYATRGVAYFSKAHYKVPNSTVQFNGYISPQVCTWRNYTNPGATWDVVTAPYRVWSIGLRDSADYQFTRLQFSGGSGAGLFPGSGNYRTNVFRVNTRGWWDCPHGVDIHGNLVYNRR